MSDMDDRDLFGDEDILDEPEESEDEPEWIDECYTDY